MSLKQQIEQDKVTAMKEKNTAVLEPLRLLWTAIKNEEIKKQAELSDEEVQSVVNRQVKQLKDALKDFEAGGRDDLVQKTKTEIAAFEGYLPAQLSDDELKAIVSETVSAVGAAGPQDTGKVMGAVMGKVKGKADGNRVKEMVAALLQ